MNAMQTFTSARLSIPARGFITRLGIIWQFWAIELEARRGGGRDIDAADPESFWI